MCRVSYLTRRVRASANNAKAPRGVPKDARRILRCHLNVCVAREEFVCVYGCVWLCLLVYVSVCTCMPAVNTVCRAPARAARVSYTVLTLSSVKFLSILHDHSDSNLQTRHFVHEASDSTSESRFFARLTLPSSPTPPRGLHLPRLITRPFSLLSRQPSLLFVHSIILCGIAFTPAPPPLPLPRNPRLHSTSEENSRQL